MKVNKTLGSALTIYGIIFAVYNLLVFIIFKVHMPVFWVAYLFTIISFVAVILAQLITFKSTDINAVFYGIPLASLSVFYLIAQTCVGLVLMIFQGIGMTISLVIQILILAGFAIVAILALLARDTVSEIDQKRTANIQAIRNLVTDVNVIEALVADPAIKARLAQLSEAIRYADPISNEVSAPFDAVLSYKITEMRNNCTLGQYELLLPAIDQAVGILNERNQRLLNSK